MPTKPKVEEVQAEMEKGQTQLTELLRKTLLAALGAAVIAQEEIEALIS